MDERIDLAALRAGIRDVIEAECPLEAVRKHIDHPTDLPQRLWKIAGELGWAALGLPEARNGLGLGLDALAVLYEEAGRAIAPIPLAPTLLAAEAIVRTGTDEQQARWLPPIAAGETKAALTAPAPFEALTVTLYENSGGIHLSGQGACILDGADADLLLVLARRAEGGLARVVVEPARDGAAVTRQVTWDGTRSLAAITLDRLTVPTDRLLPATEESEEALAIHAALALAADSIGGSEVILGLSIDYLKTRYQFGQPIGAFQALKHRVANHKVTLVADSALVGAAAVLATTGDPLAAVEVAGAKAQACRNYVEVSRDAIQLHGGIGFTAEHVCHLFLKRARLNEALFGTAAVHFDRVRDHIVRSVAL
jgi:alkylation response protein AidB-like acyl-CoA dehydrogenase